MAHPRPAHPVSFTVERGATHLIRTRSALSTPLFRLCLGFSEPSSGEILVEGREPWRLAREVAEGFECGILLDGFNDVKEGDVLEAYETKQVERTSLDEAPTAPAPTAAP